jgi:hypothetical protein
MEPDALSLTGVQDDEVRVQMDRLSTDFSHLIRPSKIV